MTGDMPSTPITPAPPATPPRAPGNRVPAGLVIAVAVAALMLLGIIGLVAAALVGDDDAPTGAGLGPQVNVDAPATAPTGDPSAPDAPEATDPDEAATTGSPAEDSVPDTSEPATAASGSDSDTETSEAGGATSGDAAAPQAGDDDFSDDPDPSLPSITTVPAMNELEPPDASDLPEPGEGPVVLPVQVTTPAPPSTFPAVPLGDVGPGSVAALDGWSEHDRGADHVAFTRDGEMVELFVINGVATADAALETFYDDVRPELEELTRSPITRLGAPSARFLSVAGSEYTATTARQQGTSTMSGTIVAAVRPDGTAVVLTTSRSGGSSEDDLAADAALLEAILAQL